MCWISSILREAANFFENFVEIECENCRFRSLNVLIKITKCNNSMRRIRCRTQIKRQRNLNDASSSSPKQIKSMYTNTMCVCVRLSVYIEWLVIQLSYVSRAYEPNARICLSLNMMLAAVADFSVIIHSFNSCFCGHRSKSHFVIFFRSECHFSLNLVNYPKLEVMCRRNGVGHQFNSDVMWWVCVFWQWNSCARARHFDLRCGFTFGRRQPKKEGVKLKRLPFTLWRRRTPRTVMDIRCAYDARHTCGMWLKLIKIVRLMDVSTIGLSPSTFCDKRCRAQA